jgi:hypothetical protein
MNDFPIQHPESDTRYPLVNRNDVPDSLHKRHYQYKDFNQTESPTQPLYISNGHPDTLEYLRLRYFFERLQWAANSAARFYSYESADENVEYWSPKLQLDSNAVYSPPCDWDDHVQQVKNTPLTEANTRLSHGSWIIRTQNQSFFEALKDEVENLDGRLAYIYVPSDYSPQRPNWEIDEYFGGTVYIESLEQFSAVKEIIDEYADPLVEARLPPATTTPKNQSDKQCTHSRSR